MIYLVYFSGVIFVMVLAYFNNKVLVPTGKWESVKLTEAILVSVFSWVIPIGFVLGFGIFYGLYRIWMLTETKTYQRWESKFEG